MTTTRKAPATGLSIRLRVGDKFEIPSGYSVTIVKTGDEVTYSVKGKDVESPDVNRSMSKDQFKMLISLAKGKRVKK